MQNVLEINNDLLKDDIVKKDGNNILSTILGKAVNEGINFGLKKILPDFIEDEIIDIKDAILSDGIREGINVAVEKVSDIGKSIKGIVTGDFSKISEMEKLINKEGGLLEEVGSLINKGINNIKDKDVFSNDTISLLKGGTKVINKSLNDTVKQLLNEQQKVLKSVDTNIENWENAFMNKDFETMEKEYNKILQKTTDTQVMAEIKNKISVVENLHTLIKNNNQDFNLNQEEIELAKKLI